MSVGVGPEPLLTGDGLSPIRGAVSTMGPRGRFSFDGVRDL